MYNNNNDNKIMCLLCCCLYPSNSSSINNETRIQEYIIGLTKFFEYNTILKVNNVDIVIIDNSITSDKKIDNKILEILPNNVKIITHSNNKYGAINKGGGLIENWLYINKMLSNYNWLIHFEPRQHLKSFYFIESFLKQPRNLFTLGENKEHFNTGLFCIKMCDLLNYLASVNLDIMITNYISIEYHLFNFIITNSINYDLLDKMDLIWFNLGNIYNM